jgi:DNA topoisomerase-1
LIFFLSLTSSLLLLQSSDDIPLSQKISSSTSKTTTTTTTTKSEEPQFKWWLEPPLPEGKKWRTLSHNGVLFAPPYKAHGVPLVYDGDAVVLPAAAEELATFYSMYLEAAHVKKEAFNRNFFAAFREALADSPALLARIKRHELCDFRRIRAHLLAEKEAKKAAPKEAKDAEKAAKAAERAKYGVAVVDGQPQPIANYLVEPPGLFLGRGAHPKTGTLKRRIMPESVTINIGRGERVPPCPVPGHKWGAVVHNDEVSWLASWNESVNGAFKYVWLAASSRVKGEADRAKYNKARALARIAPRIRASYEREFTSESAEVRQRATALWMIDVLALRVGNEKGEDEAETYGACSLLVEHVTLTAPASLKLSFLGKDSMPYENTVQVPPLVYRNIAQFVKGKRADESLFDTLTTSALNKHLKSYMDGLTAKCFRTYNASVTLERQLAAAVVPDGATTEDKLLIYNAANRTVAILCNHQRTVSKTHDETMQRAQAQLDYVLAEKKYVQKMREYYKTGAGQEPKPPKPLKDDAKPIAAPKDVAACNKRLDAIDAKLKKMNFERSEREENKTIALSTSKLNYMDPRITAAFCKRVGLPIEKVFAKTLRAKFPWALDVEPDWKFFDESLPADANVTFDGEVASSAAAKKKTTTKKRATSSSSSTKKKRAPPPPKKKKKKSTESEEEEEEEEESEESEEESDDDDDDDDDDDESDNSE